MQYAITEEKLELEHSWHSKTVGTNVGDIGDVGDVDDVGDVGKLEKWAFWNKIKILDSGNLIF